MTPYQQWLMSQSKDFLRGFDAYCAGLTDDIGEELDWHAGYEEARRKDDDSEQGVKYVRGS